MTVTVALVADSKVLSMSAGAHRGRCVISSKLTRCLLGGVEHSRFLAPHVAPANALKRRQRTDLHVRLVIGISGASGSVYGIRALETLKKLGVEAHLILTEAAQETIRLETNYTKAEVGGSRRRCTELAM